MADSAGNRVFMTRSRSFMVEILRLPVYSQYIQGNAACHHMIRLNALLCGEVPYVLPCHTKLNSADRDFRVRYPHGPCAAMPMHVP